MEQAIVQSCDVYFYDLAHDLGIDRLHDFLATFGFGTKTGVDVAGELAGLLPSREWAQRVRKQRWFPGETLSSVSVRAPSSSPLSSSPLPPRPRPAGGG
jgi:penicillin-binding protein 2